MNGGYGAGGDGGFGGNGTAGGVGLFGGTMSSPSSNFGGMNEGSAPRSAPPPRSSMSLGHRDRGGSLFSPPSGGARSYAPASGTRPSP
eukprot:scaffold23916_cov84-Amphora_coffeaeformis.AAC.1